MKVVVTGASQGIGRAIATAFAAEGATLALVARNESKLADVQAYCEALGGRAIVIGCDVTDEDKVEEMARRVSDAFGVPDVIVNNAGSFTPGSVAETTVSSFTAQVQSNLMSAFLVTRAFLPAMLEAGSGHIFFLGSVASIRGYPRSVGYCAAKHGLLGLARALREEVRFDGIRVTTVLPGATFTGSWAGTDLPEERFMPPEDVAYQVLAAYQMSPRSVVEEIVIRPQLGDV
jgi:NAD(P)-dependent dehydrogenase (short-subunit alcohol dehydrogenase family)